MAASIVFVMCLENTLLGCALKWEIFLEATLGSAQGIETDFLAVCVVLEHFDFILETLMQSSQRPKSS